MHVVAVDTCPQQGVRDVPARRSAMLDELVAEDTGDSATRTPRRASKIAAALPARLTPLMTTS
ncbi:hypothetical protein [Streptomyces sannanensis]|uniref:hypothetical protein n=1 Tax=Streptomyces sannanensis TaxID=285536 RepID=UPI0031EE268A